MTIVLSTNEEGNEGLGLNPNVQVQELGPAIFIPSQAIGHVVARTNDLLAGHREWLNSLPQRAELEQHQIKARDAPASKSSWLCHVAFLENSEIPCPSKLSDLSASKLTPPGLVTPAPSLSKRSPIPQPQAAILPECSGFVASASASGSNIGFASASAKFAISLSSVSSTASATIASLQALSASQSTALQSASIALTSASSALASANSSAIAASSSAKSVQSSAASAISVAQASAQSAITSAQSSANAAVQNANNVANAALGTLSSSPSFNLTY
jgi:hypothetical protein